MNNKIQTYIIRFGLLLGLFLHFQSVHALTDPIPARPDRTRFVEDYAQIFTAEQKADLETRLVAYNDTSSTQIVAVTVSTLSGLDISDFAVKLGHKWGVGGNEKKDNGVVILVAPNEHKTYIATGYGMEHKLTDAMSRRIIEQKMLPQFRAGNYYGGVLYAISSIQEIMSGEYSADETSAGDGGDFLFFLFIIFLFIVFIIMLSSAFSKRNGKNSGWGGDSWTGGGTWTGGGWTGGTWTGGGGSSGGGSWRGFGGGDFGGGGAGGSW